MRPTAVLAFLLATGAFILTILILFSGRNTNFLNDVYLTKIDTSDIASDADFITDRLPEGANRIIENLGLGDRVDEVVGGIVQTAARRVGVHDLYVVHIMNYCVGDETAEQARRNQSANVNWCSEQRAGWHFNLTEVMEKDIDQNNGTFDSLVEIAWPTEQIDDVSEAVKIIGKAMFVFQVGAVAGTGLSMILSLLGVFASGRLFAFLATLFSLLSFIWVGVDSALGTVVAVKLRDGFRDNLREYSIYAHISQKYLGMTWAATGAMLLCAVYWMFATCFGSRDKNRNRHSTTSTTPVIAEKPPRRRFPFFGRRSRAY